MKLRLLSLLAVLLLAGCSAVRYGERQPTPASGAPVTAIEVSPAVKAECEQVYAAVYPIPGILIERYLGTFWDEIVERDVTGCMIVISGAWSELADKPSPEMLIFQFLTDAGWHQEVQYSADGPDGTIFALSKGGALCIVRGWWDGGDDTDSTYVGSDVYQIIVRCVEFDGTWGRTEPQD
ncbi:MAG: hypothetical protein V1694_04675 [Candidatus Eisenbacteria bacterium]